MKQSIFYILLGIVFLLGCGDGLKGVESEYTIRVTGTDQLQFSGHYTIANTGQIPKPVEVKRSIPSEYKGKGFAAACVFHKTSAEGTLKVEILKGQQIVASMETTAPYGIITLGKISDKDSLINQILGKILG